MKFIIDALIGAVIAVATGFVIGLCFAGIEHLSKSAMTAPTAAATVAAGFAWVIVMMAKGGDE